MDIGQTVKITIKRHGSKVEQVGKITESKPFKFGLQVFHEIAVDVDGVTYFKNTSKDKVEVVQELPDIYLEDMDAVAKFIKETESSIYGGRNDKGELVNILLEQGVGMEVRVNQDNGWIRADTYNEVGIKEDEVYLGRWSEDVFR